MAASQKHITVPVASQVACGQLPGMLLGVICVFELLYLLLLALAPFPALRLSASPLEGTRGWSWILLPYSVISSIHATWFPPLLLSAVLVFLMGLYALTIAGALHLRRDNDDADVRGVGADLSRPGGHPASQATDGINRSLHPARLRQKFDVHSGSARSWLLLLLGSSLLFGLTLLFQPRLFSDEVFTYIFSGRLLVVYHVDPWNTTPAQFLADPYLTWVVSGRAAPNIYGPLWLCIASLLVSFGAGPVVTLLLFKIVALAAHLLNCALICSILGKVAPARQRLGTLLYAWNPLILIELAGSGHSEGVLVSLLLLATWLHVCGVRTDFSRPGAESLDARNRSLHRTCLAAHLYEVGALLVFGLALSMNSITLLLVPLYIWFLLRTERRTSVLLWGISWRSLMLIVPALIIYFPFWRGSTTFFAVTSAIDMQHFVHSPIGTLAGPTRRLFQFAARVLHAPTFLQPGTAADITLRASATFIFALIYLDLFGRVHRAPTTIAGMRYSPDADQQMNLPGFDALLDSWAKAVFWFLVLGSGWFWPWYLLWMLWIFALKRFDAFTSTVLLLSGTALFLYPLLGLPPVSINVYQPALIFGIPLIYLVIVTSRRRKRKDDDIIKFSAKLKI